MTRTKQRKPTGSLATPKVKIPAAMRRIIDALKDHWFFRASKNGVARGGFQWAAVGEWTTAPDWDPSAECGGGLHGQGPGGYGYAHAVGRNSRFEFCETAGERVVVDGDKIKVRSSRILFVGPDAFTAILYATNRKWPGSLYLSGCNLKGVTLPASVGGTLDLRGCNLKGVTLPASVGDSLYLGGCDLKGVTLPASVGDSLYLGGCRNIPKQLPKCWLVR